MMPAAVEHNLGSPPRNSPVKAHTPLMYACQNGRPDAVIAFLPFLQSAGHAHQALGWAAENGNAEAVSRILQHPGVDVNALVRGDSALFRACAVADLDTIRMLVGAGADASQLYIDSTDPFGGMHAPYPWSWQRIDRPKLNCLHRLCGIGRPRGDQKATSDELCIIVRLLVQAGAQVYQRTILGDSVLDAAASSPHSAILTQALLASAKEFGQIDSNAGPTVVTATEAISQTVTIDETDQSRTRPMQDDTALFNDSTTLSEPITTTIKGEEDNTADVTSIDVEVALQNLSTADNDVNAPPESPNDDETNPLHKRDEANKTSDRLSGAEHEDDGAIRDSNGQNALHRMLSGISAYGAQKPNLERFCRLLASAPHLVRQVDNTGTSPLQLAIARAARDEITEYAEAMTSYDADWTATDRKGNTLAHVLAENLETPQLRSLFRKVIGKGIPINARNANGEMPLFIHCGAARIQSSLVPAAFLRMFQEAASGNVTSTSQLDPLLMFAELGADFSTTDHRGWGLLHVAARTGMPSKFEMLLERGLDLHLEDFMLRTPIDIAAASGNVQVLALIDSVEGS